MTERGKQIVAFIQNFISENGYSPTVREIGDGVGLKSTSSVFSHLLRLENDGVITTGEPGQPRMIKINEQKPILEPFEDIGKCPVCGCLIHNYYNYCYLCGLKLKNSKEKSNG